MYSMRTTRFRALQLMSLATLMAALTSASGQSQSQAPDQSDGSVRAAAKQTDSAAPPKPISWSVALGMRAAAVQQRIPTLDRVVLVPNEATFVDEIGKWRLDGRWPVLIEDDVYAPMFLRAFAPKQIVRRTGRATLEAGADALKVAVNAAVVRAWNGDPATMSPLQAIEAQKYMPPGLAAYSATDPAWVAAVALAAGHGLLPVQLEGDFGNPNSQIDSVKFAALDQAIRAEFEATKLPFDSLGDALEVLALCRNIAHKAVIDLPESLKPSLPPQMAVKPGQPVAVTDALCRNQDGRRYALCGSIFGSSARSAYTAMSSLFLNRQSVLAIDCYPEIPAAFAEYGFAADAEGISKAGYRFQSRTGNEAKLPAWREHVLTGFDCDVLFLNTSGNPDFFDLGTPGNTPASSRGVPGDVPILSRPLALHMIHSFSLAAPASRETIGGRWLESGVYAYAGSVYEPFLPAFQQPPRVLEKCANFVPFAVAARQWDGPFSVPWRITTLGDPLMLCAAPVEMPQQPRGAPAHMVPGEVDAVTACRVLLAKCKSDPDGTASMQAMQALARSAQDKVAAQLWNLCATKSWAARVAPGALESLFQQRDADGFLKAYALTAEPTPRNKDMLWQLWGQRLDRIKNVEQLMLFQRAVRSPWPSSDWERLAGPFKAATDVRRVQSALLKVIEATENAQQKAAMQELLNRL